MTPVQGTQKLNAKIIGANSNDPIQHRTEPLSIATVDQTMHAHIILFAHAKTDDGDKPVQFSSFDS
jgi:hypothetical protein